MLGLRLSLFGRSVALIVCELAFNVIVWVLAGAMLGHRAGALPLALLAWVSVLGNVNRTVDCSTFHLKTHGLRHGLDADHIRQCHPGLLALNPPQTSVLCGFWFSMGHSTIVIAVNIAIACSVTVYDRLGNVSDVGGIVGASVSGSFLFLIGLANSLRCAEYSHIMHGGLMMRIFGPISRFMYPVGVLFGFGFDTASTIALLGITAVAQSSIQSGMIALLPFIFTAGMSLVDSLDSILMAYAYAGIPNRSIRFKLFETAMPGPSEFLAGENATEVDQAKRVAMSNLSIVLTLMSILLAFSISLITIMSLIGDNCKSCQQAAGNNEGLPGKWWRAWADAADKSGYIGASIVAAFLAIVAGYYSVRWIAGKRRVGA
ncbi:NicO-domain-containing protein [Auriculariales sp. MPI-PUGE-AT-0066]|nr:NicO-domain-containing protein [Auriculariales sp. MPI-PUGE-AT-0066]